MPESANIWEPFVQAMVLPDAAIGPAGLVALAVLLPPPDCLVILSVDGVRVRARRHAN
jgi:hypothetical protein